MAYSVAIRQSCHRYLSPCRQSQKSVLCTTATHPTIDVIHHHSLTPLPIRGRSSVKPPAGIHHQKCHENHILSGHYLFKYDKDDVGRYDISHNLKTSAPLLDNTKERNNYLDINSIMRIIGALHIDLPKVFSWKQNKKVSSSEDPHIVTKDDLCIKNVKRKAVSPPTQDTVYEKNPNVSTVSEIEDIRGMASCEQMEDIKREQLSFSEAMEKQNRSVKNYYGDKSDGVYRDSESVYKLEQKNTYLGVNQHIMNRVATVQSPNTAESKSNIVKQITSYLPGFVPQKQSEAQTKHTESKQIKKVAQRGSMPRSVVDRKTRGLVKALTVAKSTASKYVRLEDLCHHLVAYPEAKTLAVRVRFHII